MFHWIVIVLGIIILSISISNPFFNLTLNKIINFDLFFIALIRIFLFLIGVIIIFFGLYVESLA